MTDPITSAIQRAEVSLQSLGNVKRAALVTLVFLLLALFSAAGQESNSYDPRRAKCHRFQTCCRDPESSIPTS